MTTVEIKFKLYVLFKYWLVEHKLIKEQNFQVPSDIPEEEHERDLDYNNNAGILNSRETGQIHHLIPPARQSCEVDEPVSSEDKCFFDEPVILGYCTTVG